MRLALLVLVLVAVAVGLGSGASASGAKKQRSDGQPASATLASQQKAAAQAAARAAGTTTKVDSAIERQKRFAAAMSSLPVRRVPALLNHVHSLVWGFSDLALVYLYVPVLGVGYARCGHFDLAIEYLESVQKQNARNFFWQYWMTEAYIQRQRHTDALRLLTTFVTDLLVLREEYGPDQLRDPRVQALLQRALQVQHLMGRPGDADKLLQRLRGAGVVTWERSFQLPLDYQPALPPVAISLSPPAYLQSAWPARLPALQAELREYRAALGGMWTQNLDAYSVTRSPQLAGIPLLTFARWNPACLELPQLCALLIQSHPLHFPAQDFTLYRFRPGEGINQDMSPTNQVLRGFFVLSEEGTNQSSACLRVSVHKESGSSSSSSSRWEQVPVPVGQIVLFDGSLLHSVENKCTEAGSAVLALGFLTLRQDKATGDVQNVQPQLVKDSADQLWRTVWALLQERAATSEYGNTQMERMLEVLHQHRQHSPPILRSQATIALASAYLERLDLPRVAAIFDPWCNGTSLTGQDMVLHDTLVYVRALQSVGRHGDALRVAQHAVQVALAAGGQSLHPTEGEFGGFHLLQQAILLGVVGAENEDGRKNSSSSSGCSTGSSRRSEPVAEPAAAGCTPTGSLWEHLVPLHSRWGLWGVGEHIIRGWRAAPAGLSHLCHAELGRAALGADGVGGLARQCAECRVLGGGWGARVCSHGRADGVTTRRLGCSRPLRVQPPDLDLRGVGRGVWAEQSVCGGGAAAVVPVSAPAVRGSGAGRRFGARLGPDQPAHAGVVWRGGGASGAVGAARCAAAAERTVAAGVVFCGGPVALFVSAGGGVAAAHASDLGRPAVSGWFSYTPSPAGVRDV
eukprot:m.253882 g.253882  ORF g.253882 m.253882 type:complete len:857 (-) comp22676_c0_seq3:1528-4098(-)